MPDHALQDLRGSEAVAPKRFDPRSARPFINKSVSEETRRAYRRAISRIPPRTLGAPDGPFLHS
jgi:hypothetical protein